MTAIRSFSFAPLVGLLASVGFGGVMPAVAQTVSKPKTVAAEEAKAGAAAKALAAGMAAFESGKMGAAITSLSTAIAAGGLTTGDLAKALFYRGVAQKSEKKPAAALSDLNAAVWLRGGLSATDKAVAEDHRQALLREVTGQSGVAPVASTAPAAASGALPWEASPTADGARAVADLPVAVPVAAAPAPKPAPVVPAFVTTEPVRAPQPAAVASLPINDSIPGAVTPEPVQRSALADVPAAPVAPMVPAFVTTEPVRAQAVEANAPVQTPVRAEVAAVPVEAPVPAFVTTEPVRAPQPAVVAAVPVAPTVPSEMAAPAVAPAPVTETGSIPAKTASRAPQQPSTEAPTVLDNVGLAADALFGGLF